MELLQVFDENRVMLDESINRNNKHELTDSKHFMVTLLFIENENGEFLIQKTSKEKGSLYAVTGGHVTYMDGSLTTVKKEVKEELGIILEDDDLDFVGFIDKNNCFCDIYYTNKNIDINSLILQKEEVESVCFLSVDSINELIENNEFRKGNIDAYNIVLERKCLTKVTV